MYFKHKYRYPTGNQYLCRKSSDCFMKFSNIYIRGGSVMYILTEWRIYLSISHCLMMIFLSILKFFAYACSL